MFIALLILHVLVAVGLVFIVLLQSGRGAELGAAFGGVGQSSFGRSQSTFITKFTTGMAVVFMATSLALAFLTVERPGSSVVTGGAEPPSAVEAVPQGTLPTPAIPSETPAPPAVPQSDAPTTPPLPQTDAPPQSSGAK